jgi:predicted regulator of Ras-like GTPase activity (Roadblock/LC7/MglB family)
MISGSSMEISKLLMRMNEEGGFLFSVLTDHHGLPIASAARSGQDADDQSAVVAMVQKSTAHIHDHLAMGKVDLIQLSDEKGRNLIIRTFFIKKQEFLLAILTPNRRAAFKNIIKKVVKQITESWEV